MLDFLSFLDRCKGSRKSSYVTESDPKNIINFQQGYMISKKEIVREQSSGQWILSVGERNRGCHMNLEG